MQRGGCLGLPLGVESQGHGLLGLGDPRWRRRDRQGVLDGLAGHGFLFSVTALKIKRLGQAQLDRHQGVVGRPGRVQYASKQGHLVSIPSGAVGARRLR